MSPSSQRTRLILFHLISASIGLLFCNPSSAQTLTAHIRVVTLSAPATVKIEGEYPKGSSVWSFRSTYGHVVGLGDRIQDLALRAANGAEVQVRRVSIGEFQAERAATHFSYQVALTEPADLGDAAHVSGLNPEYGCLMLADLLPTLAVAGLRVEFQLPEHWNIASSSVRETSGMYQVSDPAKAVFFIGRDLHIERKKIGATEFSFVSSGPWPFSGVDVTKLAAKIIADHTKHAGFDLRGDAVVMLAPFPGSFGPERWSAETRGTSVVLLLGRNASREVLLGQLSVVLSHELFHLWVPNAIPLDGEYDWFYEGFTLYQALRTAIRLGFVSFQEYLNTLARVYDSYLATAERDRYSLIEASVRRWTAAPSLAYDKGMLVAFLYDLRLRKASHSRRSLDDVYHELFRRFPAGAGRAEGSAAIISVLVGLDGDEQFAREYIQNAGAIDLESLLPPYGITLDTFSGKDRFMIADVINKQQRELFGALGYRRTGR
jgi:hypothetical protein